MSSHATLAAHLRTLTEDQLAGLVAMRRDATIEPVPKTVDKLAERLLHPSSMAGACALLALPQLQVGEAAAALGDGCTTVRLAGLLGVPEDDADLAGALRRLTALVLVWPRAGGLAAAHLSEMWPHPLGLGAGAADLLVTRNMTELRKLAKLYGVSATGRGKDELITALAGWLAEPENVRRLVAEAPAEVRGQLGDLARQSDSLFGRPGAMFGSPGMVLPWAVERGLLIRSMWNVSEMPREVALALREGFRAPFRPRPPVVTLEPIDPAIVEREAAAAATETLAAITAVVEAMSAGPVPLLKTGGLGVRELRRIAKASGQDEDRTRLTVELLAAGGLTEASQAGLTPSTAYDDFGGAEPADQLLEVIEDWLTMPASPLAPPDPTGPSARILYWDEEEELILTGLRALTMRTVLGVVPEGQATDPGTLAARLSWESPVLTDQSDDDLERYVTGIWREAHRLALLAHGTMTTLGRVLFDGGRDAARGHAEAMLPRSRDSVLLPNDLTAVVTGTPSAALLALLDGIATQESRSGAWTWRFSPASVRAALDAGYGPEDLIARLTEAAEGGRVPQTLTYLIEDVARRHGRVQVRSAGCCLCSDDETLLTEILNTRSLRALELVRLAPTVLISAKAQADTLAALRAAGYAPSGIRADGSPMIEVPQRRRAAPPPHADMGEGFSAPALGDPATMARRLLGHR
ncbi:helicase-associated domain-containing protein [Actinoplanes rectilineatus]|uniref:helicase-associated domain-containing protein n=1 Tax=Actinoplanes rectilineatus TaxID=113571 RepID=UPI0012FC4C94|nr:helicase-associated domain-containing protein [Actinoplanes rectilineatus]